MIKLARVAFVSLLCLVSGMAQAQDSSQSSMFKLGKNLDIQYSILRNIASSYVDTVDFDKMIPAGIEAMLQSLDPYTTYIAEAEEEDFALMTTGIYGGVGSTIKKRPNEGVLIFEPYENSPILKAGLQPGDTIIAIDGIPVYGETSEQSSSRMKGQPGTDVTFKVIKGRTGDTLDVVVTRERIHVSDIAYSGIIRDSIGYVRVSGFTDKVSDEFRSSFLDLRKRGISRLVIDLRDNGGGIMDEAIKMLSFFVPKGTLVVSSKGRNEQMNQEYRTKDEPIDTEIPLLVMVNSSSASASEIFAGAIQDLDRGIIAGRRTFGKGLIQSVITTPYDGKVKITTGKYYTPSGRCVQALDYSHRNEDGSVGFIPDSLKKEFRTAGGRSVYDGGGITPDIEAEAHIYSRPAYSLVYNDILGEYSIRYFKSHPEIAPAEDFRLSDAEYDEFVKFAEKKEFDSRGGAAAYLDQLVSAAKLDGLYDTYKTEIEALKKKIETDKRTMLLTKKDEIRPLLEEEIAVKYYCLKAGEVIRLRDDDQLFKALDKWPDRIIE
ncbi:MAG: S41 family peptidase [Bacteroidales bacterium]|nr:S41 family peptidase [Bacteroidales bacterium]